MFESAGPLIEEDDIEAVSDALRNSTGPKRYYYVEKFEADFAAYHGRKYCLLTPNCTTAIHLVLAAMGIDSGHVVVPDLTWIGSSAGISWLGANPVFCDIEADSWCLSPESLEHSLQKYHSYCGNISVIDAIIAVNLYGNMADWDKLDALSKKYGTLIIEDFAESLGSTYNGKKSGSFGLASVCSFHRTKTLTTLEGGALLLDDDDLYKKCVLLRDHGRCATTKAYFNEIVGFKYMPTNVQGALGCSQLAKLDKLISIKRHHFARYKEGLKQYPLQWNLERQNDFNSAWISTFLWNKSDFPLTKEQMLAKLVAMDVPARPIFYPLSSLPAYNTPNFGKSKDLYQVQNRIAYDIADRGISLPGAMTMTEEEIDITIEGVKAVLNESI